MYYKKDTEFGSQNFGYQIWFCTRLSSICQCALLLAALCKLRPQYGDLYGWEHVLIVTSMDGNMCSSWPLWMGTCAHHDLYGWEHVLIVTSVDGNMCSSWPLWMVTCAHRDLCGWECAHRDLYGWEYVLILTSTDGNMCSSWPLWMGICAHRDLYGWEHVLIMTSKDGNMCSSWPLWMGTCAHPGLVGTRAHLRDAGFPRGREFGKRSGILFFLLRPGNGREFHEIGSKVGKRSEVYLRSVVWIWQSVCHPYVEMYRKTVTSVPVTSRIASWLHHSFSANHSISRPTLRQCGTA